MNDQDGKIVDLAIERRRRGPRFNGGLMGILEASRDLVCLCRGGAITAINGAGIRLLGAKSSESVLGRDLKKFLIPEYGELLRLFLSGCASEDQPVAMHILALDRTVKDLQIQVFRAREIAPDATVVIGRAMPVPHRGETADGIDPRLSALADNAFNLICQIVDGVIRYINPAGLALLGTEEGAGTWVGRRFSVLFQSNLSDGDLESLAKHGRAVSMTLLRADGTAVPAEVIFSRMPTQSGVEIIMEARILGVS